MLSYNSYNEAFGNDEFDQLDQMARSINNKKRSGIRESNKALAVSYNEDFNNVERDIHNHKKNMHETVKKANKSFEKDTIKGIEAFRSETDFQFSPTCNFIDEKSGKYKGDFSSGLPSPLENSSLDSNSYFNDSFSLESGNNSQSPEYFNDISSEYSFLPKKKQKHLRLNNKHLQEYTENDEQPVLDHIRNCNECKNELIKLLKRDDPEGRSFADLHISTEKHEENKSKKEEGSIFGKINYIEMKEIVILIMIGIIIIFVLDIFLRR